MIIPGYREDVMKVVMTGSSGMIGTALASSLESNGDEVVRLVRRPPQSASELQWNPAAARGGLDPALLDGTAAAVNLAGAPIAAGRWTAARKQEIQDSRIASTRALTELLTALPTAPSVLLSGSAIGYYGDTGGREVDESGPIGEGFLAGVVRQWEAAAAPAAEAGIRLVYLRTGIVLSRRGGVLKTLLPVFRLGLGAKIGSGTQVMSWITLSDWVRIARYLISGTDLSGPVNLTAPQPATNAEFTDALAAAAGHRARLGIPAAALQLGLGEVSGELLSSARVIPRRLLDAGADGLWQSGDSVGPALAAELRQPSPAR
jgi:uncharacterized protein (TIGR01777 family)